MIVKEKRERPDYLVMDPDSGRTIGVELTSVYSSDRSAPDQHKQQLTSPQLIPFDQGELEIYKRRLVEAIQGKVAKARADYDASHGLILAVYVNEYISIHMEQDDWEGLVKDHEATFDEMAPFNEVVFWNLHSEGVFSVQPDIEDVA